MGHLCLLAFTNYLEINKSLSRCVFFSKSQFFVSILFSGGKIWCEIVEDLEQGTELLASFTTHQSVAPDVRESEVIKNEIIERDVKLTVPTIKKQDSKNNVTPQPGMCIWTNFFHSALKLY